MLFPVGRWLAALAHAPRFAVDSPSGLHRGRAESIFLPCSRRFPLDVNRGVRGAPVSASSKGKLR
ncbi:hypothetical protein HPP92_006658 [Vanilla planifolia]|uniref:Uncharacterized protein n=1 Tax=Vanilla planifolia TaxID=51239 RepID=A0A835RKB0_VANPL|nr:hypothetical protein HPP92_006658 [Vanilla planifolia]